VKAATSSFILRKLSSNILMVGLCSPLEVGQSFITTFMYMALRPDWCSWFSLMGLTLSGLTAVSRTPLKKWSARRRNLYLISHNTHKRLTSMPPAEFETTIPTSERLQTHTLDRVAISTDLITTQNTYRGADKSLARPTSRCIFLCW